MSYASASEFEQAVKRSIRDSGKDAGIAYREMLRDRFLCRIFNDENPRFLLKGAAGMLARIPDARATKDVDFAARDPETAKSALQALTDLASKDLGDFCTFRLTNWKELTDENGYSRLLKLRFASFIGDEEKDPILIDLSLDCAPTQPAEHIAPANRIEIEGIAVFDYLIYPLADQLADKLCAIMEIRPNGWPSSRMKDLVDVITYITNESIQLTPLVHAIRSECAKRLMPVPTHFKAPESWGERFAAYASRNGLSKHYANLENASALASAFFNPALVTSITHDATWNPGETKWVSSPTAH